MHEDEDKDEDKDIHEVVDEDLHEDKDEDKYIHEVEDEVEGSSTIRQG